MSDAAAKNSLRATVYWWLERPDRSATGPRVLEALLIALITINVLAVVFETVDGIYARWQGWFQVIEYVSLTIFVIEYLARLWVSAENPEIKSRWRWARSPSAVIDLLAVLPALLAFVVPIDLRILRLFRMIRLLKLTRYSSTGAMILNVIREESGSFFAGFFILLLVLILTASGAWLAEHDAQPEDFGSIPAAMWWAVATLTTVGYGDVTPVTAAGKIFGAIVTIVGIGMAALPAGILASGLSDQLRQRRDSLRNQFRIALEDGVICAEEEAELEVLRLELGISRTVANAIKNEFLVHDQIGLKTCPHCGKMLK